MNIIAELSTNNLYGYFYLLLLILLRIYYYLLFSFCFVLFFRFQVIHVSGNLTSIVIIPDKWHFFVLTLILFWFDNKNNNAGRCLNTCSNKSVAYLSEHVAAVFICFLQKRNTRRASAYYAIPSADPAAGAVVWGCLLINSRAPWLSIYVPCKVNMTCCDLPLESTCTLTFVPRKVLTAWCLEWKWWGTVFPVNK